MGVTILERLHEVKPNGRALFAKNESLRVVYDLVRKHMGEIEEARSRGYSWRQIDGACRETWQADGKLANIVWWKLSLMVEDCYRAVKNGTTVVKKHKTAPLSLMVTVTKQ